MRTISLALIAILLIATSFLWAQKNALQKSPVISGKYAGRTSHHPHLQSMRNGRHTLDNLYSSTDVPRHIPEVGYVTSTLTIPDNVIINDLNVHVVITHPWIRDLHVTLIGPDTSVRVTLFDVLMLDSAVNMDGWFDDGAGMSIAEADTPLIGTWRPMDSLALFSGRSSQGTWTLAILDTFPRDSGTLEAWALDVNPPFVLEGTVQNGLTDAPVREAKIQIVGTSYVARANAAGHYEFLNVDSSGTYSVRFTKSLLDSVPWYDTLTVNNVFIQLGTTTVFDTLMNTMSGKYEFASPVGSVPIPDVDTTGGEYIVTPASMTIQTDVDVAILDVKVLVNITHTYDSDLLFWLRSPAGDSILLANRVGGNGHNFVDCYFEDAAETPIFDGTAPFTGFFRPERPLSVLRDSSRMTAGTWTLMVEDSGIGDVGTIQNFALEITQAPTSVPMHDGASLPQALTFVGNYPNPFNSRTEFRFDLARRGRVVLVLYNVLGQRVADVVQGMYNAGTHVKSFDARILASGVYIARMTFNGVSPQSRKVLLLR